METFESLNVIDDSRVDLGRPAPMETTREPPEDFNCITSPVPFVNFIDFEPPPPNPSFLTRKLNLKCTALSSGLMS